MRIAIDASQILYKTGVSHYVENLIRYLLKDDRDDEILVYGGSLRRKDELFEQIKSLGARESLIKVFPFPPTLADFVWNRLHVLPIDKLIGNVDVIHTSDWAEPPSRFPKVTTIHDLTPLKFPMMTPKVILATHERRLRWVSAESERIIVPSENTKNDLVSLGFDEGIIRVTPEAPNFEKANEKNVEIAKKKYLLHDDYLIAIGTKPWKNIDRVIKAYHLAKSGKNLKLVVVGERKGTNFKDERGVRFLGLTGDHDLAALITGARALVFPSLYEGFGMPVLDAFNCGVPVVTSNDSSLPEAAGEAAALVDPLDTNSIAEGIEKVLRGPKGYIEKGEEQVKKFSWEKTAKMTLDVYREVAR